MDIGFAEEQELLRASARWFTCEVAFGDATWYRERVARLMTV